MSIAAIECGPDHLHLFVKQWKNWKIPVLAGQLKTYSSRMMRKGHSALFSNKLWRKKFWSAGYFHRTVGAVTAETVKRYIAEGQRKRWKQIENKKRKLCSTLIKLSTLRVERKAKPVVVHKKVKQW